MAIIKRGILGGFSNKIGNVVGTSWKGISVMRALPQSVHNPRTGLQTRQRQKFSIMSKLGSGLLDSVIKPYWDPKAVRMSGYNLFVSENLKDQEENINLNFDAVKITKGCPLSFEEGSMSMNVSNQIDGHIKVSSCSNIDAEEATIHVFLVDDWGNVVGYASGRYGIGFDFQFGCLPEESGHIFHVYAYLEDPESGDITNSVAFTEDIA